MNKRVPENTKVVVLMGGWSAERKVSLASGEACAQALKNSGFDVMAIDVKAQTIVSVLQDILPDVVFNSLHGGWGENGSAAAVLETLRIPYTHSGVLASAIAMDKEKSKVFFRAAGIPVAESKLVATDVLMEKHHLPLPYVIKPVGGGSSVGVHIVRDGSNGPPLEILEHRELFGTHVLVERFVPGKELACAVMGNVALGVTEIIPRLGFYDYEAKYAEGASHHVVPADIPVPVYRKCQRYALMAHHALGCRGVTRADFRFDEAQPSNHPEPILLEINTQAGMTQTSLLPELAAHAGHSFEELVTWMVNDASVDR